jgi:AcrR family transcriptional regulator
MSTYIEKNKKTKASIRKAFMYLLESSTFDAITVGHIAKEASINRGTFYLHYLDKYDLLDQIEQELFEDLGKHIEQLQQTRTTMIAFDDAQTELANTLFSYILLHAPTLKIFLSNKGRAGFHYRFKESFMNNVRGNIEQNEFYRQHLHAPFEYFLSFITSAFLGLIEQWVQNDLQQTPEEMTAMYIEIISFIKKSS